MNIVTLLASLKEILASDTCSFDLSRILSLEEIPCSGFYSKIETSFFGLSTLFHREILQLEAISFDHLSCYALSFFDFFLEAMPENIQLI